MVSKVLSVMEKYHMIAEGDLVAAGVSGGADSLCLLFMLMEYQKKVPFQLVVVHVNHGLRKEACEEAAFVKKICEDNGIPVFIREADVRAVAKKEHLSEEEAGRKVRYEAFEEALGQYSPEGAAKGRIAVAHHQGDSAETFLFHLFRGTGIHGMAGILPVHGKIIRPLLTCSREEIEAYLTERKQKWCIDRTNEEDTYTRNKIRHHILGYASEEINDRSVQHVAQAALQMTELRNYLDDEVKKIASEAAVRHPKAVETKLCRWKTYPEFLQKQYLLWALSQVAPGRKDLSREHISAIWELTKKEGSKRIDLPGNLEAVKEYDILWIRRKENKTFVDQSVIILDREGEYPLENGSVLEISVIEAKQLPSIEEKTYTKYFDYDKISSCLNLRLRQAGDYLIINDQGQRKTLKEYFIDEKVPSSMRYRIPVIADKDHILWIVGYRISAYYKVTPETKKIVQMTLRRNEHVRES